ncbi:hypothetical protein O185_02575 [Photorhabdus temperata J3]|uniref:Uncharacterized protein n=1 Tax=Photorhabdus temperata J3 TaxID=1389415 RepID=U7R4D3_PHOTE|nr:hypothetical protein O185_02575 [Photorhabdus temperata J3]
MIIAPPSKDGDDFFIGKVAMCVILAWLYNIRNKIWDAFR